MSFYLDSFRAGGCAICAHLSHVGTSLGKIYVRLMIVMFATLGCFSPWPDLIEFTPQRLRTNFHLSLIEWGDLNSSGHHGAAPCAPPVAVLAAIAALDSPGTAAAVVSWQHISWETLMLGIEGIHRITILYSKIQEWVLCNRTAH